MIALASAHLTRQCGDLATPHRHSPPRATIWFIIVWNVVIGTVLVVVFARQSGWTMLPLFEVFVVPSAIVVTGILWRWRHVSSASSSRSQLTGTVLTPAPHVSVERDSAPPGKR